MQRDQVAAGLQALVAAAAAGQRHPPDLHNGYYVNAAPASFPPRTQAQPQHPAQHPAPPSQTGMYSADPLQALFSDPAILNLDWHSLLAHPPPVDPNTPVQQTRYGRISRPPVFPPQANVVLQLLTQAANAANGVPSVPFHQNGSTSSGSASTNDIHAHMPHPSTQPYAPPHPSSLAHEIQTDPTPLQPSKTTRPADKGRGKKSTGKRVRVEEAVPSLPSPPSPIPIRNEPTPEDSPSPEPEQRGPFGSKRRRLTAEELIERRKARNRRAADTSRRRKKEQMDDMSDRLAMKTAECDELKDRCAELQARVDELEQHIRLSSTMHGDTLTVPTLPTMPMVSSPSIDALSPTDPQSFTNGRDHAHLHSTLDMSMDTPASLMTDETGGTPLLSFDALLNMTFPTDENDPADGDFIPPTSPNKHSSEASDDEGSDFEEGGNGRARRAAQGVRGGGRGGRGHGHRAGNHDKLGDEDDGDEDEDDDDDEGEDDDDGDEGALDVAEDEDEDLFLPIVDVPVPVDQLYQEAMTDLGVSTREQLAVVVRKLVETTGQSGGGVSTDQLEALRRVMMLAEARGLYPASA